MSQLPVITISREYGSGGRAIGERVAKELGIPFYDKQLILMAAKESGLSEEFIKKTEQIKSTSFLYGLYMGAQQLPMNDQIFLVQSKIIRSLADQGPCVIVGRCADWVLEKNYNVLRVYVCAALEERCKRAVEEYGDKPEGIQRTVKDIDKQRARYCQHYCDQAWEDASNYDLCLNSGKLGLEHCVRIVRSAYEEMTRE